MPYFAPAIWWALWTLTSPHTMPARFPKSQGI